MQCWRLDHCNLQTTDPVDLMSLLRDTDTLNQSMVNQKAAVSDRGTTDTSSTAGGARIGFRRQSEKEAGASLAGLFIPATAPLELHESLNN